MVARQNFAANVTDSISALDGKIDATAADLVQTIAVDGSTLSITSGAGTTDTYLIQDTTYDLATTTNAGLMSASDKSKLDGLSAFELPTASTSTKGGVKIGNGLAMNGDTLNVTLSGGGTNSNNFTEQVTLSGGFVSRYAESDLRNSTIKADLDSISADGALINANRASIGADNIKIATKRASIQTWMASIDADCSTIEATGVHINGYPHFTGRPQFDSGFIASGASIRADSTSIYAGNASIDVSDASINAGGSASYVAGIGIVSKTGGASIGGYLTFTGEPTFTGQVTFTEPIYIDNTGSTVKGALCFDVANNLPRLKVRMNNVDYIFNCDTSVTSGSG